MSTSYKVVPGDTIAIVASRNGVSENVLRRTNPGISDPLAIGSNLTIPGKKPSKSHQTQANRDEISLTLAGSSLKFWSDFEVTLGVDTVSTCRFTTPFDPAKHRETFIPMSFPEATCLIQGEPLFRGVVSGMKPEAKSATMQLACYSTPGVLMDCTPHPSNLPLNLKKVTLGDICRKICEPFGINVVDQAEQNTKFNLVKIDPTQNAWASMVKMAKQRNVVLSSTIEGDLLLSQPPKDLTPVAEFTGGQTPIVDVDADLDHQSFYSTVTGLYSVKVGDKIDRALDEVVTVNKQEHVENEAAVPGLNRPKIIKVDNRNHVVAEMGSLLAQAVSFSLDVATWRDPSGNLWKPGSVISLIYPEVLIYKKTPLMIRSVTFTSNETARLQLVLPEVFTGGLPKTLPWL